MSRSKSYTVVLGLVVGLIAAMLAGCAMPSAFTDAPNWSLTGSDANAPQATGSTKKYGDWSGASAPRPMTYDDAR